MQSGRDQELLPDTTTRELSFSDPDRPPHPADTAAMEPAVEALDMARLIPPPLGKILLYDPIGGTIPSDEPVFLIRATDRTAAAVLRRWLELNDVAAPHWTAAMHALIRRCENWPDRRQAGWRKENE